jgi:AcrR family transcriptional regulator
MSTERAGRTASGVAATRQRVREATRLARRDVHRQSLLEAAERTFAARGYEGTRMQDVAAEAGLALASVYGLVAGKEELYAEVHRMRGAVLLERATVAAAGAGSAFGALEASVRAYTEFLVDHPDYLTLHLHESQPWALEPRFTSDEQGRLWRSGLALAVEVFRAAVAEGSVVDESPSLLARLMIAAHQVFLGEWVSTGMREPREQLIARMLRHLRRAFRRAATDPAAAVG